MKPVITLQTHILPETQIIPLIKPRIGQGRAGIKRNMLKFPVSQPYDKPEPPKLLPGRKLIIQIAERSTQSRIRSNISTPENSIILDSSGHHHKVILLSDYIIPQCQSIIQFLEQ